MKEITQIEFMDLLNRFDLEKEEGRVPYEVEFTEVIFAYLYPGNALYDFDEGENEWIETFTQK